MDTDLALDSGYKKGAPNYIFCTPYSVFYILYSVF
jgi:hypothetical protein